MTLVIQDLYLTKLDNGITVYYDSTSNGGGSTQYPDFIDVLNLLGKKYSSAMEWCSGSGFIGFSLLDYQFADTVTFVDLHDISIECINYTAEKNNIRGKIQTYMCDEVKKLPDTLYDLIVANPPHVDNIDDIKDIVGTDWIKRVTIDEGWKVHEEFFTNIGTYLNKGADILLSETNMYQVHIDMAEKAGLRYVGSYPANCLRTTGGPQAVIMHYTKD